LTSASLIQVASHHHCQYQVIVTPTGMPHHQLTIKIGGLYQLMCNFSIDYGLVKNVQVIVIGLGQRLITIQIVQTTPYGTSIDNEEFLLPRIIF
jgi:hypothetical protein